MSQSILQTYTIDAAIIKDRFSQVYYDIKLEQVPPLVARNSNYSTELQVVVHFYKDDFNKSELQHRLQLSENVILDQDHTHH